MMVTNTSVYQDFNPEKTGVHGHVAQINMLAGTTLDLLFKIVEADTTKVMPVASLIFSILDLDNGSDNITETITLSNFTSSHLTNDTQLLRYDNSDGTSTFAATQYGNRFDNPTDPQTLTPVQKSKSVSFAYSNTSHWTVSLNVTAASTGRRAGRNFEFTGESSLMLDCPVE